MDGSGHEGEMPIPITSAYLDGHDSPPLHHHRQPYNGPPPFSEDHHSSYSTKRAVGIKYRECLKNHAASIGGNATDGCGEFMPSGEEGSLEALKCSACGCHRNFHRKETDGEEEQEPSPLEYLHPLSLRGSKGTLLFPRVTTPHHAMIMPLQQTSESNEMMAFMRPPPPPHLAAKRRFRTKFTAEQKEKMLGFAEKVEWRLQREQEGLVQQFCQEIGVKRRVFKVWMHNNKHNFAKKNNSAAQISSSNLNIDH
ncbi:zinc-finger homeodomain protein 3-like [Curcuma longa]|uniref:zinc-finger homeodomain protein 3-like n=1 Tax=Curcuma longa TaxID=136217 RepID=UPI003D9EAC14